MSVRVVLLDAQPLYRDGIASGLEGSGRFEVLSASGDLRAALAAAARARPDLIVLDVDQAGDGVPAPDPSVITQLRQASPAARIVVLTANRGADVFQSCFAHGASAYLLKDVDKRDLLEALHVVQRGGIVISTGLPPSALAGRKAAGERSPKTQSVSLTPRERQTLALVAAGLRTREIGRRLQVSPRTIETYRARLLRKVGARNVASLLRRAASLGLLD